MVLHMALFYPFSWLSNTHTPHLLYPCILQWTFRLLLCLGYYKQRCYKHKGECIFFFLFLSFLLFSLLFPFYIFQIPNNTRNILIVNKDIQDKTYVTLDSRPNLLLFFFFLFALQFYPYIYLGIRLQDHIVTQFLLFKEHPYCFPQWLQQFTFPTRVYEGSLFLKDDS